MKRIGVATALFLTSLILVLAMTRPTEAAVVPQNTIPDDTMSQGMMPQGSNAMRGQSMMGTGMMNSGQSMSTTLSMAEMGEMLDTMTAMMAGMPISGTMPMTGTMPLEEMGQMMQMMGMMHQHMGQMQMMMGGMMAGGTMPGGMMDMGMMSQMPCAGAMSAAAVPEVPADDAATAADPESATTLHPPLVANPVQQSATAGAITVEVTPLAPSDPLEVAFEVVLDTHSVELSFDLAERATLVVDDLEFPATAWEPNASGGHHVTGILRFAIDETTHQEFADAETVRLAFTEIDGEDLTFLYSVE